MGMLILISLYCIYEKILGIDKWLKYRGDQCMHGCYDSTCDVKNLFLIAEIRQRSEQIWDKSYDSMNKNNEDIFYYAIRNMIRD